MNMSDACTDNILVELRFLILIVLLLVYSIVLKVAGIIEVLMSNSCSNRIHDN